MKQAQRFMAHWGVLIAFALLFTVSALLQGGAFLNAENMRNLLNQNAPVGVLAVGMTLVIVSGGIDLSVGSMLVLAAAVGTTVMNALLGEGWGEGAAVCAGVAACVATGTAAGALNGSLVVFGRIAPFIATLGGLAAYRSIALAMAQAGEIRSQSPEVFRWIGSTGVPLPGVVDGAGRTLVIFWGTVIFLLIAAAAQWALSRTRYGRHLIATGANEVAARYAGISIAAVRLRTYTIMGALAAVAGLIQSSRMNSVSTSQLGLYSELDAIAAVVIGGTSLRGGFGRVWGTVIGVLILGMITNILLISGVSPYWQGAVKGVVILLAVLVQRSERA